MFKGEKLAEYLKEHAMSYEKFGEKVGISKAMVGYLVHGFKSPSAALLKRIAEAMTCPMEYLIE